MKSAALALLAALLAPRVAALRLDGQRVVVTGGGRGIGKALALLCAEEGAHVAILARSREELAAVVDEAAARGVPTPLRMYTADVTDEASVEAAVAALVDEMGGVDILLNNAGNSCRKGPLHEQSVADFRSLLDLNVVSVLIVSSAVMRHAMLRQGKGAIINISSRAGKVGLPNMAPYVASKFAVEGLTATLAAEAREHGIRVNSLSPGMVDTRSFPKAPGRPGVRTAESIRDGLFFLLLGGEGGAGDTADGGVSGVYLHVDEFDEAVAAGRPETALKSIDERPFECVA